eukprot:symbB.v1.2.032010.t1/scaffold3771.1/size50609/1
MLKQVYVIPFCFHCYVCSKLHAASLGHDLCHGAHGTDVLRAGSSSNGEVVVATFTIHEGVGALITTPRLWNVIQSQPSAALGIPDGTADAFVEERLRTSWCDIVLMIGASIIELLIWKYPLWICQEQLVFRWNLPDSHGCPIDKYEVAKVPQLVEDLNKCETDEEQKALLDALPVKEFHGIKVEELTNRKEPVTATATKDSLHVGFSLPYDNGDRITKAEVCWFRLSGPMERHLALGGKITVPGAAQNKEEEEGYVTVDVPETIERALQS